MESNAMTDERSIEDTLIRYTLGCDRRDWELFGQVFVPDVSFCYDGEHWLQGRDKLVRMIRHFLEHCGPSQHLLGNTRISITGDEAETACYVRAAHAGRGDRSAQVYEVWGEYCDKLVRTAEGWRIRERRLLVSHETGLRSIMLP